MSHTMDGFPAGAVSDVDYHDSSRDDFGGRPYGLEPLVLPPRPLTPVTVEPRRFRRTSHRQGPHGVEPTSDPRLRQPSVLACERDMPRVLTDIAEHVTKPPLLPFQHPKERE
jgi:hypothetical protein